MVTSDLQGPQQYMAEYVYMYSQIYTIGLLEGTDRDLHVCGLAPTSFACIYMKLKLRPCANNLPNLLQHTKTKQEMRAGLVPNIIYFSEMFEHCFLNDAQLKCRAGGGWSVGLIPTVCTSSSHQPLHSLQCVCCVSFVG